MATPSPGTSTPAETAKARVGLESLGLLLLSLATVGTAWCSYQATTWGAAAQRVMNQSMAASRLAATDQLRSSQMALLDVMLFSQFVNAYTGSNAPLARFYSERFRGEARTAFEAWMATRPFEDPAAPPHPFVTNFYNPQLVKDAARTEEEAEALKQQAGEAGRISRAYVLITVLLASALFCGGTASKFDILPIRRSVLVLGLGAFAFAIVKLISLPVQL